MSNERAVLWDLDGTLIDSRRQHWQAWHATMADEGFALTEEQFAATFGQRNDRVLRTLLGPELPPGEITRISEAKEALYRELISSEGISLLPGAEDWLARLRATGWRQALASSAPRQNIAAILAALGLDGTFAAVVGSEDVQRGKPDPQVFLIAAEQLAVAPARCIVVEDAHAGIAAAQQGGMRTIAVRTTHNDVQADLVVDMLSDLPADAFVRLIGDGG